MADCRDSGVDDGTAGTSGTGVGVDIDVGFETSIPHSTRLRRLPTPLSTSTTLASVRLSS